MNRTTVAGFEVQDDSKNWLFFGSDQGGRTLATLASFTATCGLFKLNPWLWLRDALTRLPLTPTDRRGELLPTPSAAPQ